MTTPVTGRLPKASRRQFVLGTSAAVAASFLPLLLPLPLRATAGRVAQNNVPQVLMGDEIALDIGYQTVNFTGNPRIATTVNGSLPAPTIRLQEGQKVTIHVTNHLEHDSSIHWHGIILPAPMDGVPGISFAGIRPGETFTYRFDALQSGTYWYHSHSGFQEQTGLYGALIIDPKEEDPVAYDREHTVVLSDWMDDEPHQVYATLKKLSHYYNFNERTLGDWWRDVREKGFMDTWRERRMWNRMRMSDTDIADVTGAAYTYLMNGVAPADGWTGLFEKGERVRLRFVNASAMSIFDVRIPGLKMTVVAADGQNVQPVVVDEFRIGTAETYDVVVEPEGDRAYTVFAQSIDRTGYARGTLAPRLGMRAEIPALDPAPVLSHRDMGMGHGDMNHRVSHGSGRQADPVVDHSEHYSEHHSEHGQHEPAESTPPSVGEVSGHGGHSSHHGNHHSSHHGMHTVAEHSSDLGLAGYGSKAAIRHVPTEFGPHVDMRADAPVDGIDDPGIGLREHQEQHGRRVLTYGDLRNLYTTADMRQPSREIQIHLTGNMGRYMWSMNGVKFADAAPIELRYGERMRILLVNDTMMTHPIHLHGMWSELETGDPRHIPRKHTVLVQPGSKVSYLVTADAKGRWAYHCHLMFHMPGMMREVVVRNGGHPEHMFEHHMEAHHG